MFSFSINEPSWVHFIGIGGVSMSGLAELLVSRGFTVSGSDSKASKTTEHLESLGIKVFIGNLASNISGKEDVVVYTAAVHQDNEELCAARDKGIPLLTRAELLGLIMKGYKDAVNIAGTHGKTTTTSMLASIELASGFDPTVLVGGDFPGIGGNLRVGKTPHFVAEACEYTNSFLSFFPAHEIIMNIEEDHLDFFKDINDIRNSFRRFMELVPEGGILLINGAIPDVAGLTKGLKAKVLYFGLEADSTVPLDYTARNISYDELGLGSFTLVNVKEGRPVTDIKLSVCGAHNLIDALAAASMADALGADPAAVSAALGRFTGAKRRFEYKGEFRGAPVFDDYSHHPSEIEAALKTAKRYGDHRVVVVFQPHTYTRTRAFLPEFAKALSIADSILLAPIYAAREKDPGDISSDNIAEILAKEGKDVHSFKSFDEIKDYLSKNILQGDLLITMGAGDIVNISDSIV
ncbi:MAG: UDP-N-acetylmuramate--L-alanine ligase [Lachnospiraceae bacterium]|nr:UDP-N-acetylmuramate--L-alanine ligase [Lachnospiraceae bacterium]